MLAPCVLAVLTALTSLTAPVQADDLVKVIQPASLAEQFTDALIPHSSALFGVPPAGRSMVGEVLYAPASDKDGCEELDPNFLRDFAGHVVFIMVDRGSCTFVEKVRHVQMVGGHAAIIRDNVNEDYLPYMADDGTGGDVSIPSVLISFDDGGKLEASMAEQLSVGQTVQLKMTWNIPNPDGRVEWMMWTTPVDEASVGFKNTFGDVVRSLEDSAQFTPHYIVLDGEYNGCTTLYDCGNQCTNNGRYCNYDPDDDEAVGISGADVVQESVRQLCFFQIINGSTTSSPSLWWDYVKSFEKNCNNADSFSEACSFGIMSSLGVSQSDVQQCISDSGGYGLDTDAPNTILEAELAAERMYGVRWWPMLLINNSPYYEALSCPNPIDVTTCGPLNMICGGYAPDTSPCTCSPTQGCPLCEAPSSCQKCMSPDDPDFFLTDCSGPAEPTTSPGGGDDTPEEKSFASVGAVVGLVLFFCSLVAGGLYWHFTRKQEKMRMDIDQLLAQYQPMGADGSVNNAALLQDSIPMSDAQAPPTTSVQIHN